MFKMSQTKTLPTIVRVAFLVHLIVAVIIGLGLLVIPDTVGGWFGFPAAGDLAPLVRAYGAMVVGFGGLTSLYGYLAKRWEQVAYIVHGEITFLALQTIIYIWSALSGVGPALGDWMIAILSAILLALFALAFVNRPK
jgi:hypothetical protein